MDQLSRIHMCPDLFSQKVASRSHRYIILPERTRLPESQAGMESADLSTGIPARGLPRRRFMGIRRSIILLCMGLASGRKGQLPHLSKILTTVFTCETSTVSGGTPRKRAPLKSSSQRKTALFFQQAVQSNAETSCFLVKRLSASGSKPGRRKGRIFFKLADDGHDRWVPPSVSLLF